MVSLVRITFSKLWCHMKIYSMVSSCGNLRQTIVFYDELFEYYFLLKWTSMEIMHFKVQHWGQCIVFWTVFFFYSSEVFTNKLLSWRMLLQITGRRTRSAVLLQVALSNSPIVVKVSNHGIFNSWPIFSHLYFKRIF